MRISDINTTIEVQKLKGEYNQKSQEVEGFELAMQKAVKSGDVERLKKVAVQFEEVFMNMLMKAMRSTVGDGGLIEKSNQEQIFQSMLDEKFAKEVAEAGGIGIADMMVQQLKNYITSSESEKTQRFDGLG